MWRMLSYKFRASNLFGSRIQVIHEYVEAWRQNQVHTLEWESCSCHPKICCESTQLYIAVYFCQRIGVPSHLQILSCVR